MWNRRDLTPAAREARLAITSRTVETSKAMIRITHLLGVLLLLAPSIFAADVKISTLKHLMPDASQGNASWQEEVRYVHGAAQRQEFAYYTDASLVPQTPANAHIVFISHCDTGTEYEVDLDNREYREFKIQYPARRDVEQQVADTRKEAEKKKTSISVDTGETREFHGHTARHLVTTIKINARSGSSELAVDGWYLDMPQPGCTPEWARRYLTEEGRLKPLLSVGGGMPAPPVNLDGIWMISPYAGRAPDGLAIEQKSVHRSAESNRPEGANEVTGESRVLEFSEAPLDPALFEVPPGFTKVKQLHRNKTAQH